VLFGSSRAHKELRRELIENNKLEAVISLPSGVFRPYAGVSTAILVFTKTGVGGTDFVWFYDVTADGWSLDDKRQPLLPEAKLGPWPNEMLTSEEERKNNLPDVVARWADRNQGERKRGRTEHSFCVHKSELLADGAYDLSFNRYGFTVHQEVAYAQPNEIIGQLKQLEEKIGQSLADLEKMLA
jgi:type I restriction enzyme M protein